MRLVVVFAALLLSACTRAQTAPQFDRVKLSASKNAGAVVLGDFNGDGRLDIAVANPVDGTVTIFLNKASGRFQTSAGSPFPAGPEPSDIAVGDLNDDGKPDLVIANHDSAFVTILLGSADGRFVPSTASPINVQVHPHPHGVALGDFNGDGNLDLTVESWQDDEVKVFAGDGRGGFKLPGVAYKTGRMPYHLLRTADVNGDGHPDIITTNFRDANATVLLNDGHGRFLPAPGSPFAAGLNPFGVVIADLNGDTHLDLAVVNYSGQASDTSKDAVNILYADGSGRFRSEPRIAVGRSPIRIAAGDLDGDVANDLLTANLGGSITVLFNRHGRFDRVDVPLGNEAGGVAIGKLLQGRTASIVVTQTDGTVEILTLAARH